MLYCSRANFNVNLYKFNTLPFKRQKSFGYQFDKFLTLVLCREVWCVIKSADLATVRVRGHSPRKFFVELHFTECNVTFKLTFIYSFLHGQISTIYVKYLQILVIISRLLKPKNHEIILSNFNRIKYSFILSLSHSNFW